jgi:uncharacterized protein
MAASVRPGTGQRRTRKQVEALDWPAISRSLDDAGTCVLPGLVRAEQCTQLAADYGREDLYRSRVVMARHGFGRGEYRYFRYPLPGVLQDLRETLYPKLVAVANRWNSQMGIDVRYPGTHAEFIRRCHRAGQKRPTALILQYVEGDYNCLHQDIYGEHVFPLQLTILLSRPGSDFDGGEFVVTEVSAREKRATVIHLSQGDAVLFAVNQRPTPGARSYTRAAMRHGVSRVHRGLRHTVGIIFHDAA